MFRYWPLFSILTGFVLSGFSFFTFNANRETNPLDYEIPQQILNTHTFHVGDTITVRGVKCNAWDEAIAIEGQGSFYRRTDIGGTESGLVISSPPGVAPLILGPKECSDRTFISTLPALAPGKWVRTGIDCTLDTVTRWCRSWKTEEFEVLP